MADRIVLDISQVAASDSFKGIEIHLHRHSAFRVLRVVHPDSQEIHPHQHDRAYIGIYTLGSYTEMYDGGEARMSGPCAVLHPVGRPHADVIGSRGLETLTVEFDTAWLKRFGFDLRLDRSRCWSGGAAALAARVLARTVTRSEASAADIGAATASFLAESVGVRSAIRPTWLDHVELELGRKRPPSTATIARMLDLNAAWLARAYREQVGEGMHETARRRRVEHAARLLRRTESSLAEVAVSAGFCDQGHMNRCFRQVVGRTPLTVRRERSLDAPARGSES